MSKTLFERTIERATHRSIEEIREEPLSELHERLRQRNNGKIPLSPYHIFGRGEHAIVIGPYDKPITGEEAYKQAMEKLNKF